MELTRSELYQGMTCAGNRRIAAITNGLRHAAGIDHVSYEDEAMGALAELAVARSLDVYFPAVVNPPDGMPDIPPDWAVRATTLTTGCLIVRPHDPDHHRYVLVIMDLPRARIVGWIHGAAAKQAQWLRAPNGRPAAWFVPQAELEPWPYDT